MSYRTPCHAGVVGAGLTLALAGRAEAVRHADCVGSAIRVEPPLGVEWKAAAGELAERLAAQEDLDRCAVVTISGTGREIAVQAVLRDGRSAMRRVRQPAELAATVEALLVLPPPAPSDEPRPESGPLPVLGSPMEKDEGKSTPARDHSEPPVVHLEIGLAGSARASGAPLYWGPGAIFNAQVSLDGWLVAAEGHWDVFDDPVTLATASGFNMQTVAVGFAVGRRLEGARLRADILLGPELLVENEEASGAGEGLGGTSNDVRAHLTARLLPVQRATKWRWFGALDADVSPARLRRATYVDPALPASPAWSAALAIGLLWEIR